jgi:hypothetical protein
MQQARVVQRLHSGEGGVDDGRWGEPVDAGFGVAQARGKFDAGNLTVRGCRGGRAALELGMALEEAAEVGGE